MLSPSHSSWWWWPRDGAQPESDALDFGTGGMALAVKPALQGESAVSLYCGASLYYNANTNHAGPQSAATPADDGVSVIAAVRFVGNASFGSATLQETNRVVLDGSNGLPKVYGVCGMAVGDIIPEIDNPGPELVVTSLMGHLLVFALDPTTGAIGGLQYQAQVEGALGVYSSIVIADLDNNGSNELYVAGSLGLRRWIP